MSADADGMKSMVAEMVFGKADLVNADTRAADHVAVHIATRRIPDVQDGSDSASPADWHFCGVILTLLSAPGLLIFARFIVTSFD
jgi:hypothetical protein